MVCAVTKHQISTSAKHVPPKLSDVPVRLPAPIWPPMYEHQQQVWVVGLAYCSDMLLHLLPITSTASTTYKVLLHFDTLHHCLKQRVHSWATPVRPPMCKYEQQIWFVCLAY